LKKIIVSRALSALALNFSASLKRIFFSLWTFSANLVMSSWGIQVSQPPFLDNAKNFHSGVMPEYG
jgi:hypothetical protein